MDGRLKSKVAIVTGGCSGIGRGIVEAFVREGARVMIGDLQEDKGRLMQAAAPQNVRFIRCDVASETDIAALVARTQESFGALDIMVNNAGIPGPNCSLENMPVADWDKAMAVLLRSVMLGVKHAIPALRQRGGGVILNISSVGGERAGVGGLLAYGTAKAGVIHLTKMAAAELAKDLIRVNAVSPGFVATSIYGEALGMSQSDSDRIAEKLPAHMKGLQPLPIAGVPSHIASACVFLASTDAEFVTGISLPVDGGFLVESKVSTDPEDPNSLFQAVKMAMGK